MSTLNEICAFSFAANDGPTFGNLATQGGGGGGGFGGFGTTQQPQQPQQQPFGGGGGGGFGGSIIRINYNFYFHFILVDIVGWVNRLTRYPPH